MEGFLLRINVRLIDFISDKNEIFLLAEMDDFFHDVLGKTSSRGITGVDNGECSWLNSLGFRFGNGLFQIRYGERPVCFFVEVIGDRCALKQCQCCCVERVLWNGDEDTVAGRDEDCLKDVVYTLRCAGGEKDIFWVGGVSVTVYSFRTFPYEEKVPKMNCATFERI